MCTNLYDTTAEDDDSNPEKTCKSRRAADAVGGDCTGDPGARVDASVRHHQLVPVQVAQSSEDALGGFSDYGAQSYSSSYSYWEIPRVRC